MITFSNNLSWAPGTYAQKFNRWNNPMEYMCIGSTGFAQAGQPDYETKLNFELEVVLPLLKEKFGMYPMSLPNIKIELMPNEHDMCGCYHEFVVIYNRNEVDLLEDSEETEALQIFEDFWEWMNQIESFDWEEAEQIVADKWAEKHVKVINLKVA